MNLKKILFIALRLIVALIFLQTLFFKFTAHPDSVALFTKLGVEPYGRIGLGIIEFIVSILVLIPKTALKGMILSLIIISGAIMAHLGVLGVVLNEQDGGAVFGMAVVVFIASSTYVVAHKQELKNVLK